MPWSREMLLAPSPLSSAPDWPSISLLTDSLQHDTIDALNASGHFPGFEYAQNFSAAQQQQQHPAFAGPPTPPNQGLFGTQPQQQLSQAQSHQIQQQHGHSPLSSGASNGPNDSIHKMESFADESMKQGGSDDDENATPAQSRRKAQNRAA